MSWEQLLCACAAQTFVAPEHLSSTDVSCVAEQRLGPQKCNLIGVITMDLRIYKPNRTTKYET